ncbi:hypothetical protein BXZ70DRAFT_911742 [Cristinia sonorae]|uniref:Uncharacterized protein n=1 Tax=Cristinia sonorae TaxID=1940300 RepID=A0A8K0UC80_9AGAR|nr:hypothetical protein BXZ70DRAFT_911742 [Cristinia sonorae]
MDITFNPPPLPSQTIICLRSKDARLANFSTVSPAVPSPSPKTADKPTQENQMDRSLFTIVVAIICYACLNFTAISILQQLASPYTGASAPKREIECRLGCADGPAHPADQPLDRSQCSPKREIECQLGRADSPAHPADQPLDRSQCSPKREMRCRLGRADGPAHPADQPLDRSQCSPKREMRCRLGRADGPAHPADQPLDRSQSYTTYIGRTAMLEDGLEWGLRTALSHSDVQRGDTAERDLALAIFKRDRGGTWEEARVLRTRQNAKRSSGGLAPNVPLATSSSATNVASHGTGSNASQSRKRSAATQESSQTTEQRLSVAVKRAKISTIVQSVQRGVEGSSSGKPFVYHDQSIASLLRQLEDSGNPVCCVQLALVLDRDDLFFMCHQCETAREGVYTRYYGVFYLKTKLPFFKQKGKQGLTLTCKGYGPRGVRWLHPKVAVIDARLACIDGEGHPPSMVTQYLGAMMHEIKENVHRFELVIDFPNDNPDEFLGAHQVKIEKLTKEIKEYVQRIPFP